MIDYIEALRNLKPGESLVIPVAVHRTIKAGDRIPETAVERVDKLQVRHVFVAPHPDDPPQAPKYAPPEASEYDPDFAAEVARAEIVNEVLDVIRS